MGLISLLEIPYLVKSVLILQISLLYLFVFESLKNLGKCDLIVGLFFLMIIVSQFLNVDNPYLYKTAKAQILPMLLFPIASKGYFSGSLFFEKGKRIVFVVAVIGLLLYFISPSYYTSLKLLLIDKVVVLDERTDLDLEASRLSAFWLYPYWVSYSSAIFYSYILLKSFKKKFKHCKEDLLIMVVLIAAMFFAGQRLPMAFSVFITLLITMYGLTFSEYRKNSVMLLVYVIIFIIIISYIITFVDPDIIDFIFDKFSYALNGDGNNSFIGERFEMFAGLGGPISLFGDGLGRYSFVSARIGHSYIADNAWLRLLYENGIIGLLYFVFLFLYLLILGVRDFKHNIFEVGIIIMYVFSMTGADCLTSDQQHPVVLWICCGRIYYKYQIRVKKRKKHSNILI